MSHGPITPEMPAPLVVRLTEFDRRSIAGMWCWKVSDVDLALLLNKRWHYVGSQQAVSLAYAFFTFCGLCRAWSPKAFWVQLRALQLC